MTDEIKMKNAEGDAIRMIAEASREAAHVIANAAAEALKVKERADSSNEVAIARLDTKVDGIRNDIQELKSGTAGRIDALEKEKNDKDDSYIVLFKASVDKNFLDIYTRLVALETSKIRQNTTMGIGIALLSLLVGLLSFHIAK